MADFPFDDFNGLRNGDNATLNNVNLTQITFPNGSVQTAAGGGGVVTDMTFNPSSGVLTLNQDSGGDITASGFPTGSGGTNTFVVNNDLSSKFVKKIKKLEKIVNDLTLEKKTKPEKKILFGKDRILKKKISV